MDLTFGIYDMAGAFMRGLHFECLTAIFIFFVYFSKNKAFYNVVFGYCAAALAISLVLGTLYRFLKIIDIPFFENMDVLTDLAITPFYHMLVLAILGKIQSRKELWVNYLMWASPFLFAFTFYHISHNEIVLPLISSYSFIYTTIVIIYAYKATTQYDKMVENSYADTEGRDLHWFRYAIIAMAFLYVAYLVLCSILRVLDQILYLFMADIFMCIVAYCVYKQHEVDVDMLYATEMQQTDDINLDITDTESTESLRESALSENSEDYAMLAEALQKELIDKELYLKPNVTIMEVSKAVKVNIRVLSNYINDVCNKNFNSYVNDLRCNKACELLLRDNTLVEVVGEEVGFTSSTTFWRAFRSATGVTPSQYRKNHNM